MSHTTTVKSVKVTNVQAMRRAVEALNAAQGTNYVFTDNGHCQLWGTKKSCAFTITVPGVRMGLNVGFEGNEAEGYTPVFDAHGGWIAEHLGGGRSLAKTPDEINLSNIGKLMHQYSLEVVRTVAGEAGCMLTEQFNAETGQTVVQLV